jgi:hypothetical protein
MTMDTAKISDRMNRTAEDAATSALKARNVLVAIAFVQQIAMAIMFATTMFNLIIIIADPVALAALMEVHAKMASASRTCAAMATPHVAKNAALQERHARTASAYAQTVIRFNPIQIVAPAVRPVPKGRRAIMDIVFARTAYTTAMECAAAMMNTAIMMMAHAPVTRTAIATENAMTFL